MKTFLELTSMALIIFLGSLCNASVDLSHIKTPKGYHIELFADQIDNARSLARGDNGTVFVGSRSSQFVSALVDSNHDGKVDQVYKIGKELKRPNGVAFHNQSLYVAEINRILRYDRIESRLSSPPEPVIVYDQLPSDQYHGWKFIAFGPDGYLYIPVGAPCNVCKMDDPRYASLLRIKPDGSKFEIFARGIRNTVGFDWHPTTRELWFTDNGRDYLGENTPPDELNYAPHVGLHFGFPYCHGSAIADPEFGAQRKCQEFQKPAQELGAHVASLGMRFWNNKIFIAEHGSWNRSKPIGYRITTVDVRDGKASNYQVFAEGWLKGSKVLGRPVDVLPLDEKSILISDDFSNRIYRIYKK